MEKSQHTPEHRRLLEAREKAGLTQGEVAERLDTYASFVSKCEAGERRLDVVELAALCRVYGADHCELLRAAGLGS
jgi:transcriptional regulator with XRE-family HTH domain